MALKRSTAAQDDKVSYANPQYDGSELSCVSDKTYDSLKIQDRTSHTYCTAEEAEADKVKRKGQAKDTAERVSFRSLKGAFPCWAISLGVVVVILFFALTCAVAGGIAYFVTSAKIADMETKPIANTTEINMQQKQVSDRQDAANTTEITMRLNEVLKVQDETEKQLKEVQQRQEEIDNTIQDVRKQQNTFEVTSRDFDGRLETLGDVMQAVQDIQNASVEILDATNKQLEEVRDRQDAVDNLIEGVRKQQATAEVTSRDFDRRLDMLNNVIQSMQAKQNTSGRQVAFTAHTATHKYVSGHILTFKSVILNKGAGYNQVTGRFTCPVAGTYLFSATMLIYGRPSAPHSYIYCLIRKNNVGSAFVDSQDGLYDSASVSVILHLSVGDFVDLGSCRYPWYISKGDKHTSFIGALIQAD